MDTKLTLKLNQKVIERAKKFASKRSTSLSKLIENYLQNLTAPDDAEAEITPLVKSLSGIIELPNDYNHKKDYSDYLTDKYK